MDKYIVYCDDAILLLMSCGYTRQQAEELVYADDPGESWGF